ncbi:MAG: sigma-70 family RNA polymerase sigma factor [Chthoniobacterales bacterium]
MSNPATEDSIESTLVRYERPLIQYALGLTSGDIDQARDIVQDTFLRLVREPEPPVGDHLAPWLFTVCRNRAHDHHRKSKRLIYMEKTAMEDSPADVDGPSRVLEQKENALELGRYLERLPENQREVIRLKFQLDLSYKEISEITSLSVGNVGFLLHTGLRKMREFLQENETFTLKKVG